MPEQRDLPNRSKPTPSPSELIFLGTGTSGPIPVVGCLTSPLQSCKTCLSSDPHNTRSNTGALFRIPTPNNSGEPYNLLVDCGKTFYSASLRWFPRHGLRKIDGLLITHAHADAFYGLDDLRAWTLASVATGEPAIQKHIDIYCDRTTMEQVEKTFPYLVDNKRATGGGDVPKFVWHVFGKGGDAECVSGIPDDDSFVVPSCGNVRVTPLPVEHGTFMKSGEPFMCLGFRVGDFSYVSDCSGVPERTKSLMKGSKVVVMDGLKWDPHASHFSIQQGREWVRDNLGPGPWHKMANGDDNAEKKKIDWQAYDGADGPLKTWLVGFSHNVEHEHATQECEEWGASEEGRMMKVAPAWDGLRIRADGEPNPKVKQY